MKMSMMRAVRVPAVLPAIMSGYRIPWQSQEYDVTYQARGRALRATWVVGVVNVMGVSYDAYVMSYEAPPNTFDQSARHLAAIAHTIRATGPVGGYRNPARPNEILVKPKAGY
jgi:hypothetical protein